MTDPLLTPAQVEAQYGISRKTLSNYRWQGIGPKYVKAHPGQSGRVKYRRSAVDAWLEASTITPGGTAA